MGWEARVRASCDWAREEDVQARAAEREREAAAPARAARAKHLEAAREQRAAVRVARVAVALEEEARRAGACRERGRAERTRLERLDALQRFGRNPGEKMFWEEAKATPVGTERSPRRVRGGRCGGSCGGTAAWRAALLSRRARVAEGRMRGTGAAGKRQHGCVQRCEEVASREVRSVDDALRAFVCWGVFCAPPCDRARQVCEDAGLRARRVGRCRVAARRRRCAGTRRRRTEALERVPGCANDALEAARALRGVEVAAEASASVCAALPSDAVLWRAVAAATRLVDAGSRLGVWRRKCLQSAVLAVCSEPLRSALRASLMRVCANHVGFGWGLGRVGRQNVEQVARVLREHGVAVRVLEQNQSTLGMTARA